MKKEVFACSLIFILSFVSLVSAGCSPDQTMFRLYQNTNSHAALWNQTIYSVQFCYNDTFGIYTGLNPHNCTGTNTLFYLSAETNSHVSNSNADGYNIPVCYGDLNCTISASICTGEYKNISRFYFTKSHISNLSDTNYPYTLCCKSSSAVGGSTFSTSLKWKDLIGNDISSANSRDDVVIYFGQGNVNFSIMNAQTGSMLYSGSSAENFTVWEAIAGLYFFNVTNSTGSMLYSNNLTVANSNDSSPSALISSPVCYNYTLGALIPFNHSSQDSDDLLKLVWDFANGTGNQITFTGYSLFERLLKNNNLGDVQKSYSVPGVYDVKLTASERGRSLSSTSYTQVVILKEGINVVPEITSPEKGRSLGTDIVFFNASQTYVVNCSSTMVSPTFTTCDGGLRCKYLHSPGSYRGLDLPYSLNFKWTLDDGRVIENKWNSSNYYGVVEFMYRYADSGEHTANLEVTYN